MYRHGAVVESHVYIIVLCIVLAAFACMFLRVVVSVCASSLYKLKYNKSCSEFNLLYLTLVLSPVTRVSID